MHVCFRVLEKGGWVTLHTGGLWAPAQPLLAIPSGKAEGSSILGSPNVPLLRQEALQATLRSHRETQHPVMVAGEEGRGLGRDQQSVFFSEIGAVRVQ